MGNSNPLPRIGVALLGAIMVGVLLGNSAISAIDPVHFRGAAIHPRDRGVATDPNHLESSFPYLNVSNRSGALVLAEGLCPGCASQPRPETPFYSTPVPYFGSREERAAVERRERRAIDAAYSRREQRREDNRDFQDAEPSLDRTSDRQTAVAIAETEPGTLSEDENRQE
jgi:hypothetical protein